MGGALATDGRGAALLPLLTERLTGLLLPGGWAGSLGACTGLGLGGPALLARGTGFLACVGLGLPTEGRGGGWATGRRAPGLPTSETRGPPMPLPPRGLAGLMGLIALARGRGWAAVLGLRFAGDDGEVGEATLGLRLAGELGVEGEVMALGLRTGPPAAMLARELGDEGTTGPAELGLRAVGDAGLRGGPAELGLRWAGDCGGPAADGFRCAGGGAAVLGFRCGGSGEAALGLRGA